jgi:hypothetical protein
VLAGNARAHVRCLAHLKAVELQSAAKALHGEAEALITQARVIVHCVVCRKKQSAVTSDCSGQPTKGTPLEDARFTPRWSW